MKSIVNKDWLTDRLTVNRAAHRDLFLKAVEGFRKVSLARFEKNIEAIKKGKWPETYISLSVPQDMTKEYDRVLQMLSAHTEPVIELSADDYAHFVQDDWQWKAAVTQTNSTYATGSAPSDD